MIEELMNFGSIGDIITQYEAPSDALDGAEVLVALYGRDGYDGTSLVVFEKYEKLWEVNGSHCSCDGLEGQWNPEETLWEALAIRKLNAYDYSQETIQAYHNFVNSRVKANKAAGSNEGVVLAKGE